MTGYNCSTEGGHSLPGLVHLRDKREGRTQPEYQREQVSELGRQSKKEGIAGCRRDYIWPVFGEPTRCLLRV